VQTQLDILARLDIISRYRGAQVLYTTRVETQLDILARLDIISRYRVLKYYTQPECRPSWTY
jgi:hypothetical protein